ncbi:MAG: hypothetical protein HYW34_01390 [Candidatus Brennerbacteria bacterium]|nr:hypothetical protein [Candidatus Brennerbacteria bacterium]
MHKITIFIIAEAGRVKRGKEALISPPIKSVPHYFEKTVPQQMAVKNEQVKVGDLTVDFSVKAYHPDAVIIEASFQVENIFSDDILILKDKVQAACFEFAKKNGAKEDGLSEEYTVYQIAGYEGHPEIFLELNGKKIVNLLKSEKLELDEKEVEHSLSYQLKYAKDDLVIVSWDGAFLFDPAGEFGEAIELLELANYQLLRYRVLDRDLDNRLQKISRLIEKNVKKWFIFKAGEASQAYREIILARSQSVSEFNALDRAIKLIGEWYSARMYDLAIERFRLDDWRALVKDKLESLEDVYSIIFENFSLSRRRIFDIIQLVGWFILMIGWFILLFLDLMAK